jgi:hypothetical protein
VHTVQWAQRLSIWHTHSSTIICKLILIESRGVVYRDGDWSTVCQSRQGQHTVLQTSEHPQVYGERERVVRHQAGIAWHFLGRVSSAGITGELQLATNRGPTRQFPKIGMQSCWEMNACQLFHEGQATTLDLYHELSMPSAACLHIQAFISYDTWHLSTRCIIRVFGLPGRILSTLAPRCEACQWAVQNLLHCHGLSLAC